MNCPICQHENLPDDAPKCPECGSDLHSFSQLTQVSNQRSTLSRTRGILAIALIVVVAGWGITAFYPGGGDAQATTTATDESVATNSDEISNLNDILTTKDEEIETLNTEINNLKAEMASYTDEEGDEEHAEGTHTIHIVREGESLWSISETYHGHGHKHGDIAEHNELDDPHFIKVGDTIIIKH
ncbi:MAG: LysM peptidoglycan-binding domain-containing protein [Bacteroidetes bacterium]|nr:LysM peptidoglycan-binding domain-containing protein [Bacteroidota bacterium]